MANPLDRGAGAGGAEPVAEGLGLLHEDGRSVRATWNGNELFRYVYTPWEPQLESPRPYFHPLRTLGGDLVSVYRPHDHVWHKGISFALSNVGTENFWGGVTCVRDEKEGYKYKQLDNNGAMRHQGLDLLALRDGVLRFDEELLWITQGGEKYITEKRRIGVTAFPELGAWQLTFESTMDNVSDDIIAFGSPGTNGRDNAGYSGLFWRGPRSFSHGQIVTPEGTGGDELMGTRGPWMGFVGRHDGQGTASTLVFRDNADNFCHPTEWFARTGIYAVVCPAPFFSEEYPLASDTSFTLRYDVSIADGPLDQEGCETLVDKAACVDLLAD
ncbi:PmoA family protein [Kribbella sp. NPDC050820]|uniref:DUF6807 domain-containing protein n=1 Tax=Kribbella sp. NPDC050820 TaxID=3155408 RepID=UPI0033D521CA